MRVHRRVLAHHIDHHVHRLDPVERAAALRGGAGGMRGLPPEAELGRAVGEGGARGRAVDVRGMPVDREIDIVEEAGADHIDLARSALLGRGAVEPHRAGRAGGLEPLAERDRGGHRARAEEIVPAGVRSGLLVGLLDRHRRLADAGQRVELGEDGDHRPGVFAIWAPFGDEGGGDLGDAFGDLEAFPGQLRLEQRARSVFLISQLGKVPDRPRHRRRPVVARIDQRQRIGRRLLRQSGGGQSASHRHRNQEPNPHPLSPSHPTLSPRAMPASLDGN